MSLDPDYERFEGNWKVVLCLINGEKSEHADGAIEIFEGTTVRWILPKLNLETDTFALTIDSTKMPKQIDIASEEGTLFGIYTFDGDRLMTCFPEDDFALRPTDFISTADTGWNLGVLERCEKPKRTNLQ